MVASTQLSSLSLFMEAVKSASYIAMTVKSAKDAAYASLMSTTEEPWSSSLTNYSAFS